MAQLPSEPPGPSTKTPPCQPLVRWRCVWCRAECKTVLRDPGDASSQPAPPRMYFASTATGSTSSVIRTRCGSLHSGMASGASTPPVGLTAHPMCAAGHGARPSCTSEVNLAPRLRHLQSPRSSGKACAQSWTCTRRGCQLSSRAVAGRGVTNPCIDGYVTGIRHGARRSCGLGSRLALGARRLSAMLFDGRRFRAELEPAQVRAG